MQIQELEQVWKEQEYKLEFAGSQQVRRVKDWVYFIVYSGQLYVFSVLVYAC